MQNLNVRAIQTELHWEDAEQNLAHFSDRLNAVTEGDQLVLLPEMFNTGFSMNTEELGESMYGQTIQWMKSMSSQHNIHLGGSLIIKEGSAFFNRFVMARPDGRVEYYDKRHLFRMAEEDRFFRPGVSRTVVEVHGWRILLQVCYDLRFPVWSRNVDDFHAIAYVANWPESRVAHWDKLLQARAIENQCYVLAVNRVGTDGQGIDYNGMSGVIDFYGEWTDKLTGRTGDITATLSMEQLMAWRKKFPAHRDADRFQLLP